MDVYAHETCGKATYSYLTIGKYTIENNTLKTWLAGCPLQEEQHALKASR